MAKLNVWATILGGKITVTADYYLPELLRVIPLGKGRVRVASDAEGVNGQAMYCDVNIEPRGDHDERDGERVFKIVVNGVQLQNDLIVASFRKMRLTGRSGLTMMFEVDRSDGSLLVHVQTKFIGSDKNLQDDAVRKFAAAAFRSIQ